MSAICLPSILAELLNGSLSGFTNEPISPRTVAYKSRVVAAWGRQGPLLYTETSPLTEQVIAKGGSGVASPFCLS